MPPVSTFNVAQSRSVWDSMIRRYGEVAVLRQPGIADRHVSVMFGNYSTMERLGGISNPTDMKADVSIFSPDTGQELNPKPSERDVLVTQQNVNGALVEKLHKIIQPPKKIGTNSRPLYWALQVRQ